MNRLIRIRRANKKSANGSFDVLFPQTVTQNVLRSEDGGVLEESLLKYDRHLANKLAHVNRVVSSGTPTALIISCSDKELEDNLALLVTLHTTLDAEPTISYNGSEPANIVSTVGDNISGGQIEGSTIFVIWNATLRKWFLINNDETSAMTTVTIPVRTEYVYTATSNDESVIVVPGYNSGEDDIIVNYNQTVLRPTIDYDTLIRGAIRLLNFKLNLGETLHFQVTKYVESTRKGLFKYRIDTRYVTYTIPEDNTTSLSLDTLGSDPSAVTVNYNQTVLRNGIDYNLNSRGKLELINLTLNTGELLHFTITDFIEIADARVTSRGIYSYVIETNTVSYVSKEDGLTKISLPDIGNDEYHVTVNHHQMVLRNGIDYKIDENEDLVLLNMTLDKNDIFVFSIMRYTEKAGILHANAGGSSGTYRYQLNVLHESYTATEDGVALITVPNFNHKRDHIAVIKDNHYLIQDMDYAIDELGNIVLLKKSLNTGESIYFTILEGAMVDVPRFNISDASGDGKDIHVDISYSEISDFYTLMLRVPFTVENAPTLKTVNGPAEPILGPNNEPIAGGNKTGSFLYLVYNKMNHSWYSLGDSRLNMVSDNTPKIIKTGISNFSGQINDVVENGYAETAVLHNLGTIPVKFEVTPCEHPSIKFGKVQPIGDIWCYADTKYLYVGNSGTSTSKFKWTIYQ